MDVHAVAQRALKRFILKHLLELMDKNDADYKHRRLFVKDIFGKWPEEITTPESGVEVARKQKMEERQ